MDIINKRNDVLLTVEIYSLVDNTFRVKINEKNPIKQRYEVEGSLAKEPELKRWVGSIITYLYMDMCILHCIS